MRKLPYVAVLATVAFAVGADPQRSDKDRLQGAWVVVSAVRDGKNETPEKGESVTWRFVGKKLFMEHENDPCESCDFDVTLDSKKNPKEINLTVTDTEDIEPGTETMKGIYGLDGDELVVDVGDGGGERPTEFKGKGEAFGLVRLKRVK